MIDAVLNEYSCVRKDVIRNKLTNYTIIGITFVPVARSIQVSVHIYRMKKFNILNLM